MTEPLASIEALGLLLDTEFEPTQLLMELRGASSLIRRRCGQYISLVEDDVQELAGNWTIELLLPQIPVQDVGEVQVRFEGDTVFTTLAATAFTWDRMGRLCYPGYYWGGTGGVVRVEYTHGYDPTLESDARVLADVESVCLSIARRAVSNPVGVLSETSPLYSVTYASESSVGLLQTELDIINRLVNPRM